MSSTSKTAILVEGKRFQYWLSMSLTRSIDQMDTLTLEAPFNHEAPNFEAIFEPFSFKDIDVEKGSKKIFTGTMLGVVPVIDGDKLLNVDCYSKAGVLGDCTAPASAFPLEFNNVKLSVICNTLSSYLGIKTHLEGEEGAVFSRVECDPETNILEFIIDLAQQRGLLTRSNKNGDLVLFNAIKTGSPVAKLEQGQSPVSSVTPIFNAQDYYSEITGLQPVKVGDKGGKYTANNKYLSKKRPHTFKASDAKNGDIKTAVDAKMGRMFANMCSYDLAVTTHEDPNGNLWEPNTTIKLKAPDAMIYDFYEFLIRGVELNEDDQEQTATLTLVLPEAYNNKIPARLPWTRN